MTRVPHDDAHWIEFNGVQGGRAVRPLCRAALRLAGPGAGRTAIDLGCGAGIESRALLSQGWRVHAVDGSPETPAVVLRTIGGVHPLLTVRTSHYEQLDSLPAADLIYAGYSLPYQPMPSFRRVWTMIRSALRPGGILAVNLFGVHDSWAGTEQMTFFEANEARALFDGLEIVSWDEEDADGPAYSGPKHWHVFDVIAVSPSGVAPEHAGSRWASPPQG